MVAAGQPVQTVATKRVADVVPITFDWHDFLLNSRILGGSVPVDYVFRPARAQATGFQLRCTTAGVTSPLDTPLPVMRAAGIVIDDGTVQWTSEVLSNASLRAVISTYTYTLSSQDIVSTDAGNEDLIYTVFIGAGLSGEEYEISHDIVLVNPTTLIATGEAKEAVAVLPVQD